MAENVSEITILLTQFPLPIRSLCDSCYNGKAWRVMVLHLSCDGLRLTCDGVTVYVWWNRWYEPNEHVLWVVLAYFNTRIYHMVPKMLLCIQLCFRVTEFIVRCDEPCYTLIRNMFEFLSNYYRYCIPKSPRQSLYLYVIFHSKWSQICAQKCNYLGNHHCKCYNWRVMRKHKVTIDVRYCYSWREILLQLTWDGSIYRKCAVEIFWAQYIT